MTAPILRTLLVVAAIGAGIFSFVRPTAQPNPVYAFKVPIQYYGCLTYDLQEGERFGNFEIRQPMQINVSQGSRVHDILIEVSHLCEYAVSMP
jgi:hypothetical protein